MVVEELIKRDCAQIEINGRCPVCQSELLKIPGFCNCCGQRVVKDKNQRLHRWDSRYNRPRILIDMDDCINSFTDYLLEIYNRRTGAAICREDIKEWNLHKYIGDYGMSIFQEAGFFENIPEKNGSIAVLKDLILSKDYDVYVITACGSNQELEEKYRWFSRYLPQFNRNRIIRCKEKELINGDVLIDDNPDNLRKCAPFMKTVVYDMPTNRDIDDMVRIYSLKEVVPLLREWFY